LTQPTKVAVLGGGVGGMTAAFELTATPELRERIADQEAALAFDFEMNFVLENGYEVAGGGVLGGAPATGQPSASPNGSGSLIEATSHWLWRETTELERASLDWLRRI
jgi:uncharacterized protein with NAD-binding domain and iron-sulfur cluster